MWTNYITGTGTAIEYSSQTKEITKPQLIIEQGNMIIGELTPQSFHTFLLFKYPIRVKLTQNILRETLDISLNYWWLRYKGLSDMGGFSLGWNLTKSAFGLSIEFRGPAPSTQCGKNPHFLFCFLKASLSGITGEPQKHSWKWNFNFFPMKYSVHCWI